MRTANDFVRLGVKARESGMTVTKVSAMFARERVKPTAVQRANFFAGFTGIEQPISQSDVVINTLATFAK